MRKVLFQICLLVLWAIIGGGTCNLLHAQAVTATILGTATDISGAVIPGVTVTVTDVLTNESRTYTSDDQGNYIFPALPLGQYRLAGEKTGFQRFVREGIVLDVNRNARVDITLQVGATTQTVEVKADVPTVDTHDAQIGELVDRERVQDLPINGREVYKLVSLLPGVSTTGIIDIPYPYQDNTVNVNGIRAAQDSEFLLDGGYNQSGWRNYGNLAPNPDAVQEFQLLTSNYDAQYGHSAGGILNVVTRSGTNQYHGSAYDFLQNNDLDARGFFPATITPVHQNQFGGTVGGPLRHDKLFGFFAYQGERISSATYVNSAAPPTAAERTGDFSALPSNKWPKDPLTGQPFPNGIISPSNRLDPVAQKILADLIPLPNAPNGMLDATSAAKTDYDQYTGKGDYQIKPSHRLSSTVFVVRGSMLQPYYDSNVPGYSPNLFFFHQENGQVSETWTIHPTLLNQFLLNYSSAYTGNTDIDKLDWPDFGSNFIPATLPYRAPTMNVTGSFYGGSYGAFGPKAQSYEGADTLTWIRGRHSIKFGITFLHIRDQDLRDSYYGSGNVAVTGAFTGVPIADFLLGEAATFEVTNYAYNAAWQNNWYEFIQDNWKVTRRLTLNLGLRHELSPGMTSSFKDFATFRDVTPLPHSTLMPNAPLGLLYAGDPGIPRSMVPTPHLDFAPRVGLALDPFGNGKTAIRAAFGIFYADVCTNDWENSKSQPFIVDTVLFGTPSFVSPFANFPGGDPYPVNPNMALRPYTYPLQANSIGPKYSLPYVEQYSLIIQQQLMPNLSIEVGYVGNNAHHLPDLIDINRPVYSAGATASNVNSRRPILPGTYSAIGLTLFGDNSNYNALEMTVNRRFSRGFTLLANYTYAKGMDVNDTDPCCGDSSVPFQDSAIRSEDYARAGFDRTQIFNLSALYQLPGTRRFGFVGPHLLSGWQANAIVTFATGFPISMLAGTDTNLDGYNTDRPNLVGNPHLSTSRPLSQQLAEWFNPAAFQAAAPGMDGTAARDDMIGPGTKSVNMSFFKNIKIHENQKLQFRAEFFNFPNHPNFGNPVANVVSTSTDGHIYSGGGGRVIQLALHYSF